MKIEKREVGLFISIKCVTASSGSPAVGPASQRVDAGVQADLSLLF